MPRSTKAGAEVLLPVDHRVGAEFAESAKAEIVDGADVPAGKVAMDIGPKTLARMKEKIADAKSLVWNGPMGVFDFDAFATGFPRQ